MIGEITVCCVMIGKNYCKGKLLNQEREEEQ